MPKFMVKAKLVGEIEIIFEAEAGKAARLAPDQILKASPHGLEALKAAMVVRDISFTYTPVTADAQLSTYTCSFCGTQALKADWGPGGMRCPSCDRVPRAAHDQQDAATRGEAP